MCRREDFHEINVPRDKPVPRHAVSIRESDDGRYYRQISQFNEFKKTLAPTTKQAVAHLYDIYSCPKKACGFKFKFPIQHQLFPEVIREHLAIGKKLRIISLTRRNFIKQAISRQNMLRIRAITEGNECNLSERVSQSEKHKIVDTSFQVDVEKALKYARQLSRQYAKFHQKLDEFSNRCRSEPLNIEYQDLLDNKSETISAALNHLEVSPDIELASSISKATSDQLSKAVNNYDELVDAVKGSEFASLLD